MKTVLDKYLKDIEERLKSLIPSMDKRQQKVCDAMKYSLSAGGKRLRPILFLEFYKMCGGSNYNLALDFACAIEMIHTYSLIHDDLPCMDDDDFRRGRPSCHKAFDYATALLAGDGLLNRSFEIMSRETYDPCAQLKTISYISHNSGIHGMVGGQGIDVCNNESLSDINELEYMVSLKTGALIKASCVGGCILANADDDKIKAAEQYAINLGIAFQVRDDLLDSIGDEKTLGKCIGSDEKQNKTTFYSVYGENGCNDLITKLSNLALSNLTLFEKTEFISDMTKWLTKRTY